MILALLAVAVFVSAAALDYASARYQQSIADRARHRAARWSVAMCLIGSVGLLAVTQESAALIIPECLGLYAGTLLAVPRS